VTEELAFDELRGELGAIQGEKRALPSAAGVKRLCDALLSRPRLARHQDGGGVLRHPREIGAGGGDQRTRPRQHRIAVEAFFRGFVDDAEHFAQSHDGLAGERRDTFDFSSVDLRAVPAPQVLEARHAPGSDDDARVTPRDRRVKDAFHVVFRRTSDHDSGAQKDLLARHRVRVHDGPGVALPDSNRGRRLRFGRAEPGALRSHEPPIFMLSRTKQSLPSAASRATPENIASRDTSDDRPGPARLSEPVTAQK
jgi:hypothetical protein